MQISQITEKSAMKKPTNTIYSEVCATGDTDFVFAAVQKSWKNNPKKQEKKKKKETILRRII